ncbi:glycosyltransferase family 2 protein [Dinghuibacter silviterrae]|uniref:GT2 family glycosyltransferase n=1 Tax=Dinghuibacter silviterrae TaxID=1539049 RepID=A0A4R8DP33_9BACT|nr:glycosyltransferase family 2 protein [Dinghuibacter silviterrae]TDW99578.1 GT2 family glycosyltransferase [Dinghuibacter silviterrae]
MELSVIIVSYNVKAYLEQCLYTLSRATRSLDAEIWVVDNASTDGTAAWLTAAWPQVRCLALDENIGYARANNLPLDNVRGKYILYLNPDTLLEEQGLRQCLAFLDTQTDAGALGVRMINGFGAFLRESKRGRSSVAASFFKMTGLADRFPKNRWFSSYYAGHIDDRETHAVPVLSGAFLMARTELIQGIGGFDERFFMFGEDIDLSYRIRKAGWQNYYYTGTTLIHFKGQSTQKDSDDYRRHFFGAMTLFVRKYYGGPLAFLYRGFIQAGILFQKARFRPPRSPHWTPDSARSSWLLVGSNRDLQAFLERYAHKDIFFMTLDSERSDLRDIRRHMGFDGSTPILFCIGDLAYGPVIKWMDREGWEAPCFFHHRDSGSIIGPDKEWPVPFSPRTL